MAVVESIGDRIRRARRAQGLTLAQVAAAIGITPSAVQQWERGASLPNVERLTKFANLVNAPLIWLLEGTESLEASSVQDRRSRPKDFTLDVSQNPASHANIVFSRFNNNAPAASAAMEAAWLNLYKTTPHDVWARAQFPNDFNYLPQAAPASKQQGEIPGASFRDRVSAAATYSYSFFNRDGTLVLSRLLGPAHDQQAISFTVSDDLNAPEFQAGDVLTFHPNGNVNFGSIILVEIKNSKAFIGEMRASFPGYEQFGVCVVAKSYWDRVQTAAWDNAQLFDYVYWLSPGDAVRGGLVEHVRPLTPREATSEAAKIQAYLKLAVPQLEPDGSASGRSAADKSGASVAGRSVSASAPPVSTSPKQGKEK